MVQVYGMAISPATRKILWALDEAGLPGSLTTVDVVAGDTRRSEFRAINPMGTVPTIVHEGAALWESNAILAYLAELAPVLAAPTALERAHTARWLLWEVGALQPLHRAWLVAFGVRAGRPDDPAGWRRAVEATRPALATLEAHLAARAPGAPFVGERFGLADLAIGAAVAQCGPAGIDLSPWPALRDWFAAIAARPAFLRHHPPDGAAPYAPSAAAVVIRAVDHAGVRVADGPRAEAFYGLLGFRLAYRSAQEPVAVLRNDAGVEVNLIVNAEPALDGTNVLMDVAPKRAGWTHVAFEVASIEETVRGLGELGIALSGGPVLLGDGTSVFVRDPDRNVIELRSAEQGPGRG